MVDYFHFDTNHIFLFDKHEVTKLRQQGHRNIYHLPLAINAERVEKLSLSNRKEYYADISFVGSLYESELEALLLPADNYIRGYVESLIQSQLQIYGSFFVEEAITDDVINRLNNCYEGFGQNCIILTPKGLSNSIAKHITHLERTFLLNEFAEICDTHIYTTEECVMSTKLKVHGPVKYNDEMNYVFANSKLNLCPTLRSISSGIPLRSLDIMAARGVLFSNYQPELAECFANGEEVIMYESMEEAFDKAKYYLKADDERHRIAYNGHKKVCELFGYGHRIGELLKVL